MDFLNVIRLETGIQRRKQKMRGLSKNYMRKFLS
jgi:hypothetical protein